MFQQELADIAEPEKEDLGHLCAAILAKEMLNQDASELEDRLGTLWRSDIELPRLRRPKPGEESFSCQYHPADFLAYLAALPDRRGFRFLRMTTLLTSMLESEWSMNWHGEAFVLPGKDIRVVCDPAKTQAEPGDLLTLRVRVWNYCLKASARAYDFDYLHISAGFDPRLLYGGTEDVPGLDHSYGFNWQYGGFMEGGELTYIYQAIIPPDYLESYITGYIQVRGGSINDPGDPTRLSDMCVDRNEIEKLPIAPLKPLEGQVFDDANANGIKDGGETGIPGITLRDSAGKIYQTDGDGRFTILLGQEHKVIQLLLKDIEHAWVCTTTPSLLFNRESEIEPLFGLVKTVHLEGVAYVDVNGNNSYDGEDTAAAYVVIQAGEKAVLATDGGRFLLQNLPRAWADSVEPARKQPFYSGPMDNVRIVIERIIKE